MSFLGRMAARISAAFRPEDPRRYQQWVQLFDQPAGVTITADNAMELSAVWACVNAITNALAPAKWTINTRTKGRRETLDSDPLYRLLNLRPNSDMTAIAFRQAMIWARLLWGNGYAAITWTGAGKIAELWPMIPHRVVPRRDPAGGALFYEYHQMEGGTLRLEQDEVFHLKGPGISGLMGDHVVGRAAKSMGLAMAAERFASTYFGNNTVVGGVLTAPFKFPRDPQGKSSVADRLRDDWAAMHRGPNSAFKPAILEGGMKWEPFETKATDAQLVESRKFQLEEIARWFGVPGHLIGIAASAQGYGKNLEELSLGFVRNTLRPLCAEMEQEADFKLLSSRRAPAAFTLIDLSPLSHGDALSRVTYYEKMVGMGAFSINDVLEEEGRNHIGAAGDVRVVSSSVKTLDQLLNPPPPPAPPAPALPPKGDPAGGEQEDAGDGQDAEGGLGMASEAAVMMLAGVFARYQRRLDNRRADLVRGGAVGPALESAIATERATLRGAWLSSESGDACTLIYRMTGQVADVAAGLSEIDAGKAPQEVAAGIVAGLSGARKAAA